jgi:hypothetical protein
MKLKLCTILILLASIVYANVDDITTAPNDVKGGVYRRIRMQSWVGRVVSNDILYIWSNEPGKGTINLKILSQLPCKAIVVGANNGIKNVKITSRYKPYVFDDTSSYLSDVNTIIAVDNVYNYIGKGLLPFENIITNVVARESLCAVNTFKLKGIRVGTVILASCKKVKVDEVQNFLILTNSSSRSSQTGYTKVNQLFVGSTVIDETPFKRVAIGSTIDANLTVNCEKLLAKDMSWSNVELVGNKKAKVIRATGCKFVGAASVMNGIFKIRKPNLSYDGIDNCNYDYPTKDSSPIVVPSNLKSYTRKNK